MRSAWAQELLDQSVAEYVWVWHLDLSVLYTVDFSPAGQKQDRIRPRYRPVWIV